MVALPRVGFIGAGRLAHALALALQHARYPVAAVASRSRASADRLAGVVPGAVACVDAAGVAERCDLVFITTSDAAIAPTTAEAQWRAGQVVAHCSGALTAEVLAPARAAGAHVASCHPFYTLASVDAPSSDFSGVTFGLEGDEPALTVLRPLVAALGGRAVQVAAEHKPLYHLASVLASNHVVSLLEAAVRLLAVAGVDEQAATSAVTTIAGRAVANVAAMGAPAALTGPVARGDVATVERHLAGLAGSAPGLLPLYRALVADTVPLAGRKGTLGVAEAAALLRITQGEPAGRG